MKREVNTSKQNDSPQGRRKNKWNRYFFDKLQYTGEYNEMSGKLIVTNVFTDDTVTHHYANKYTAKRGFERIVRMMMDNEG